MLTKKAILASLWLVVFMGTVVLCGCVEPPEQPAKEEPPVPQDSAALNPLPQPKEMLELPPPKLEEVQEAVKRIFKDAVVIDESRKPSFLVGDFNGDLSQDLAVILEPAEGQLSQLNQEFPNWIAREPLEEMLPKSKLIAHPGAANPLPNPAAGQTVRFEQSDVLLAIIHGDGPRGWHDTEATQTHLLRDVVGTNIRILPFKKAVKAYKGTKPFPMIYGDLIEQTLIGQSGFLHFMGGIYGWYDPKNYKPEPVHGSPHLGASTMR
jgi:hypothetical protein